MLAKHHVQERVEGPVVSAPWTGSAVGLSGALGAVQRLCCGTRRGSFLRCAAAAAQPELSLPAAGEAPALVLLEQVGH